jgi:hypothetical protein
MLTVPQVAKKWGISAVRVRQLLKENRIEGAVKYARDWLIPPDAPRPAYKRTWNGTTTSNVPA